MRVVEQACLFLRRSGSKQWYWKVRLFCAFQHHYIAIVLTTYGVGVGVSVDVGVVVGVEVDVAVTVTVGVEVTVGVNMMVGVCVMVGVMVAVAVAGLALWRVMRGATQRAKSSCDVPLASTVRMNLTFSPARALRSTLRELYCPSYTSCH